VRESTPREEAYFEAMRQIAKQRGEVAPGSEEEAAALLRIEELRRAEIDRDNRGMRPVWGSHFGNRDTLWKPVKTKRTARRPSSWRETDSGQIELDI
jgi:hypothetical protein